MKVIFIITCKQLTVNILIEFFTLAMTDLGSNQFTLFAIVSKNFGIFFLFLSAWVGFL